MSTVVIMRSARRHGSGKYGSEPTPVGCVVSMLLVFLLGLMLVSVLSIIKYRQLEPNIDDMSIEVVSIVINRDGYAVKAIDIGSGQKIFLTSEGTPWVLGRVDDYDLAKLKPGQASEIRVYHPPNSRVMNLIRVY